MKIERYATAHAASVKALNDRLKQHNIIHQLTTQPESPSLTGALSEIEHQHYLALDGDIVRGGYTLIFQNALVARELKRLAFLQLPLSEGIIDQKYSGVGFFLLKDALRRAPLLFGLGMGGFQQPLPKLFRILGAHLGEIPFFVRVRNARSFLRNLRSLHRRPVLSFGAGVLGVTGLGQ